MCTRNSAGKIRNIIITCDNIVTIGTRSSIMYFYLYNFYNNYKIVITMIN